MNPNKLTQEFYKRERAGKLKLLKLKHRNEKLKTLALVTLLATIIFFIIKILNV